MAGPPGTAAPEIIRIHPERIISWHIDPAEPDGRSAGRSRSSSSGTAMK